MSSTASQNPITVSPAVSSDYPALARLQNLAFHDDAFGVVAFGAHRGSEESIARQVKELSKPKQGGRIIKAVTSDGTHVGLAIWTVEPVWAEKAAEPEPEWPEGTNVKIVEDVFGVANKLNMESCKEQGYAKLNVLVVHPEYQRMGIGNKLLEEGLGVADKLKLQAVLAATLKGAGLYRKHGFTDYRVLKIDLEQYEGGKGMGTDTHTVMHRAARA